MTISEFNSRIRLSILVPVYNEEQVLLEFHNRLSNVLDIIDISSEIIFVNDGSTDATVDLLRILKENDPRVAILDLSRNFGKEAAMAAGFDYVEGDIIVIIDSDLQDPPELIPFLITEYEKGYDMVYAKRKIRKGESFLKKLTAYTFYRFINVLSDIPIPEDTGDFRLISRRALEALKHLREHQRFSKGLFAWIGYPQKAVLYERDQRYAGKTKWNYKKLWNLAIEGITSFSTIPLKLATIMGMVCAFCAFVYIIFVILKTVFLGELVKGYPSLITVFLFLGGIQLLSLGIIGEYVGRIFNETKKRPLYFVKEYTSSGQNLLLSHEKRKLDKKLI